jgi:hypothetical protein
MLGSRNGRGPIIAASILAARKLAQIDRPCPALEFCIANSIAKAEKMMREDRCAVARAGRGRLQKVKRSEEGLYRGI